MKGGPDGPEDVDAAFAEIVAGLEREGVGSSLLKDPPEEDRAPAEPTPATPPPSPNANWRGHEAELDWSWSTDEEHYVPPEPPPMPKPRPLTVVAMVLLVIAVFLLLAPGLIGLPSRVATPIALISLAASIAMVLLRIKQRPPSDGNGAQV